MKNPSKSKRTKRNFDQHSEGENISHGIGGSQSRTPTSKTDPQHKTTGEGPPRMYDYIVKKFTTRSSASTSTSQQHARGHPSRGSRSKKSDHENETLRTHDTADGHVNILKGKQGEDTQMVDAPPQPSAHPRRSQLIAELDILRMLLDEKDKSVDDLKEENAKFQERLAELLGETDKLRKDQTAWGEERTNLQDEITESKRKSAVLQQNLDKLKYANSEQAKRLGVANSHIKTTEAQLKEFETWNAQLKAKVLTSENDKAGYQSQIEKMSQIVSQLNKKGLPLPPDDSYFIQELGSLISDIRQWARLFSKGKPALSADDVDIIEKQLPPEMVDYLYFSFIDLPALVTSKSVGTKVRTRCVEVILLRFLTGGYLYERFIGMDDETYNTIKRIRGNFNVSAEEIQYWSALTSHFFIKNNDAYLRQQELEIDEITNHLYTHLSTTFKGNSRATKPALRNIVCRVSKLGMEIAQLPFCIRPRSFKLGTKFVPERMEDIDGNSTNDGEENRSHGGPEGIAPTIILSDAWVKIVFDDEEEGKASHEATGSTKGHQKIFLYKAQVSCLT